MNGSHQAFRLQTPVHASIVAYKTSAGFVSHSGRRWGMRGCNSKKKSSHAASKKDCAVSSVWSIVGLPGTKLSYSGFHTDSGLSPVSGDTGTTIPFHYEDHPCRLGGGNSYHPAGCGYRRHATGARDEYDAAMGRLMLVILAVYRSEERDAAR